jgi:ent-kaurene oxidase
MLPRFMRPLLALLTPFIYRIHIARRKIRRVVSPLINQRLAECRNTPNLWTARGEQKSSLEWLVEKSPEAGSATANKIAHRLTGINFAATHTTTNHIVNCILDLASHFDRLAPLLREEIDSVIGDGTSEITNAHLARMWKMDSFMKESQRFHPPTQRKLYPRRSQ